MSVNDEQTKNLEEELVSVEETNNVVIENTKKAKIKAIGKKVLAGVGIAAVGVIGYALGRKSNGYDDSDLIEVVDEDDMQNSDE